jgi:hypothetical protein
MGSIDFETPVDSLCFLEVLISIFSSNHLYDWLLFQIRLSKVVRNSTNIFDELKLFSTGFTENALKRHHEKQLTGFERHCHHRFWEITIHNLFLFLDSILAHMMKDAFTPL